MVTWWEALILGLVQGFAEFLPISSSGHLVLAQAMFGFEQPMLLFDVILHFGTLLAVVVYFRQKIFALSWQEMQMIVIGSLPVVAVVFFIQDQVELLFGSLLVVAVGLFVTGIGNIIVDRLLRAREHSQQITKAAVGWREALVVGIAQLLSIIPGISRSGSTVFAGIASRLDRTTAFTYSFLLSIPAVAGATVLQVSSVENWSKLSFFPMGIGMVMAFISGMLSLRLLEYMIVSAKLRYFGYYCLLVSVGVLFYLFV